MVPESSSAYTYKQGILNKNISDFSIVKEPKFPGDFLLCNERNSNLRCMIPESGSAYTHLQKFECKGKLRGKLLGKMLLKSQKLAVISSLSL